MVRKPLQADHLFDILGRYLALEFVYADDDEAPAAPQRAPLQGIERLPNELRQRLSEAAAALDIGEVRAIADEIALEQPELAQAIHREANEYRLDAMIDDNQSNTQT